MIDVESHAADATIPLTYSRVYASPDGETHFQDVAVPMSPGIYVAGIPLVDVASPQLAKALTFSRLKVGYASDWHPAPRRQFVITLTGGMELTASDGAKRQSGPGSVILVEDTEGSGKGDQTRAVGAEACVFVTVACD